jgi:hypothetical protein
MADANVRISVRSRTIEETAQMKKEQKERKKDETLNRILDQLHK